MVTMSTTAPQTRHDRDHDDSNPSDHHCVSCHSYHLRAVVVAMSKSMVATTVPMMGGQQENNNQGKAHRYHDVSNMSEYDCFY
jgi:hypothetical protein